jgi:hypothetical protein
LPIPVRKEGSREVRLGEGNGWREEGRARTSVERSGEEGGKRKGREQVREKRNGEFHLKGSV